MQKGIKQSTTNFIHCDQKRNGQQKVINSDKANDQGMANDNESPKESEQA